jgi:hypothetical protein
MSYSKSYPQILDEAKKTDLKGTKINLFLTLKLGSELLNVLSN